jgi:hypothetical protein
MSEQIIRRKAQCSMCGVRMVGAKTPFCRTEAKLYKLNLIPMKLTPHRWAWVREVRDGHGVSIGRFELL